MKPTIKVLPWAFLFAATIVVPGSAHAQSIKCDTPQEKAQCQIEYNRLEAERKEAEAAAAAQQLKSSSYERDIALLRAKIKAAQLDIQAKTLLIQTLGNDIQVKQAHIEDLEEHIAKNRQTLSQLLRKTNEFEAASLAEVLLSQSSISSFFNDVDTFQAVQESLKTLFEKLRSDQAETEAEKDTLDKRRNTEVDARYEIQEQQKKVETNQKELQALLNISEQNKKAYASLAAQKAAQASKVLAALFPLAGSKAIPFGEALNYARIVYQKTGVQPAFLLALLKQETNIGGNVGTCYLTNTSVGSGVNTETNAAVPNVMKASRDVQPFLAITKSLGYDYKTTVVSCPQSIGYGGAMGPAQFIPSTWMLLKDRIAAAVGVSVANPWKPLDAFMASAMYLSDLGGTSANGVSTNAQKNAACRYYSGQACGRVTGATGYANNILSMAYSGTNSIQSQIDLTQGY